MISVQKEWTLKQIFLSGIEDTASSFTHLAVGIRLPCNLTRILPEGRGFSQSKWFKERIFQARVLEWVAISFSKERIEALKIDTVVCLSPDLRKGNTVTFSHAVGLRGLWGEITQGMGARGHGSLRCWRRSAGTLFVVTLLMAEW